MMPTVPFRGLCDNAPRVFTELQHQLRMLDRFISCYYLDKEASATLAGSGKSTQTHGDMILIPS
jgi:hypothetical protein